jgi:hypothetical protein
MSEVEGGKRFQYGILALEAISGIPELEAVPEIYGTRSVLIWAVREKHDRVLGIEWD